MTEYISRQAVLNLVETEKPQLLDADALYMEIDNPPSEDVRKNAQGEWLPDESGYAFWICSCCKFVSEASGARILYRYCPNCGAFMHGKCESNTDK